MKKLVSFFFAGLTLLSCVNEEYDFSKIDGTAVIGKDIALPIGSLEKIKVGDFITLDESNKMLIQEEDGDYVFYFADNEPITAKITVPSFSIPFEDGSTNVDKQISISTGPLAGLPTSGIDNQRLEIKGQRIEKSINVKESHLLPYEIRDVKEVTMGMLIEYSFSLESGVCYIAKGFEMDFPDWMTIVQADDNHGDYVVEDENLIRFVKDVKITSGAPFVVKLKLTEVDVPEGSVVDGGNDSKGRPCKTIALDESNSANKIAVTAGIYAETKDFSVIPEKVGLNMHLEFSNFEIQTASVVLDASISASDVNVKISEYPDLFEQDGIVIDFYDPQLKFNIQNDFPLTLIMNADISAYKNGVEKVKMHFADDGAPDSVAPMTIPGSWNGTLVYSRQGKDGAVELPKIGDFLMAKPDQIRISNIKINSSDDLVMIEQGQELTASAAYELYAPLAFGDGLKFDYETAIKDLGLDLTETGIKSASLILNAENSLPVNFRIEAQALDKDGNPAEKLDLRMIGEVASGTQHNPVTSPIEISLNSSGKGIELNSLKLKLTAAAASPAHQGVPLNVAQALKIRDIALRLPDGVTVDVTNIFKADSNQEEENN